jgi:UDP-glucose 4-epimerase
MLSQLSNKTVLITGASGFIGSYLVKEILTLNLCRVKLVSRQKINIKNKNLEIIYINNIVEYNDWGSILKDVNYVFHLIGVSHYSNKIRGEKNYFNNVNFLLTQKIVQSSVLSKVEKIIFLSSIKVNGEFTKNNKAFLSTDKPNPLDFYGKTKLKAEKKIVELCNKSNLKYTIIRPPLVYGPNAKGNFGLILKAVRLGLPLPTQYLRMKRSLISIYNLVDFLVFTLQNQCTDNQTILVADQEDITISTLISKISNYTFKNSRFRVIQFPFPAFLFKWIFKFIGRDDYIFKLLMPLQIDKNELKTRFFWRQKFTLSEGLKKTLYEKNF